MIYMQAIAVMGVIGGSLATLLLLADRYLCNYGDCLIKLNADAPFSVKGGGTLLDVLYCRRIFIPSACGGQGTCGFCKVRVPAGGGPLLPTELPYLSAGEIDAGTRLACQVKVRGDMQVLIREEFLHVQEFSGEVTHSERVTSDTRELHIRLLEPERIEFHPGQYVQIFVPDSDAITFRAYSIASPPSRSHEIELLVRLIPGGRGSGYLHRLKPGDSIRFTGPYGEFKLDPDLDLVCIGGGCGMAPMRSILRYLAEQQARPRCWLFFGARTSDGAMYRKEFQELARGYPELEVHYALSEPDKGADWTGETGFIHESAERHLDNGEKKQAFLCGPPPMIEAAVGVLTRKGIPKQRIFYDEF